MSKMYIGMKGHVVCLEQATGKEIWRTKVKSSQMTNIVFEEDKLYVSSGGHLFCLNANNGDILWENKLSGLGYGPCIIATQNQANSLIAANIQAQQAAAAASSIVATSAVTSGG